MLNYYEYIALPGEFIMDYDKVEGSYVKFADGSVRNLSNPQESKAKLQKQYEYQVDRILDKYSSKKLKRKHKKLQTKQLQKKYIIISIIAIAMMEILLDVLAIPFLAFMILGTGAIICLDTYIENIDEKKLKPLQNQIEEVEKLELWKKEKGEVNYYLAESINKQLQKTDTKISKDEKKQFIDSSIFQYIDLDQFTLEELKCFIKEIRINYLLGENTRVSSEELGHQKTIGTRS